MIELEHISSLLDMSQDEVEEENLNISGRLDTPVPVNKQSIGRQKREVSKTNHQINLPKTYQTTGQAKNKCMIVSIARPQ